MDPRSGNVRQFALTSLLKIDAAKIGSKAIISQYSQQLSDPRDRYLLQAIVLGVLRYRLQLDHAIFKVLHRPHKIQPEVLQLLRIGLFQAWYMDRIPDFAIVHEMVAIAKKKFHTGAAAVVNAVLRKLIRLAPETLWSALDSTKDQDRAILSSHPAWLISRWRRHLAPNIFDRVLEANNTLPPKFIKRTVSFREQKTDRFWESEAIETITDVPGAYRIHRSGEFQLHEIISEPQIYAQDIHSQWVVKQATPETGERVLDACAGRGGKSIALLDNLTRRSSVGQKIWSLDNNISKLRQLQARLTELPELTKTTDMILSCWDLQNELPSFKGYFNTVLLDAPCSNLGVLRRHPEIRWRIRESDMSGYAVREKQLLTRVAAYVAPQGTLIYAVCSFEPEEGCQLIRAFLREHRNFRPISLSGPNYSGSDYVQSDEGFITFYPTQDGGDGFFAAKLERTY